MKLISVMIMALLLVAGIGSAQNYLPETVMEPGADLSMFSGDPGNVEMASGNVNNATYINSTYGRFGSLIWTDPAWLRVGSGNNGTYDSSTVDAFVAALTSTIQQPTYIITPGLFYMESMPGFEGFATGGTFWVRERSGFTGGNHSGIFVLVEGNASGASPLWGQAIEVRDYFSGETASEHQLTGLEIVTDKQEANGTSISLDIMAGGNQTQTAGIRIGKRWIDGEYQTSQYYDGIQIQNGIHVRAINISAPDAAVGIDTSFGSFWAKDAIRSGADQRWAFREYGVDYIQYNGTTDHMEIRANSRLDIFVGGVLQGYFDGTGYHDA